MLTKLPKALTEGIQSGFSDSGEHCNQFNDLCFQHGSDKGTSEECSEEQRPFPWQPHNYGAVYGPIISDLKNNSVVRAVFECGIGTNNTKIPSNMSSSGIPGASLRIWQDFFPDAQILGADLDPKILINEGTISSYWVNQRKPKTIDKMWRKITEKLTLNNISSGVDLMIDDGLHTFEANTNLLTHSWGYLRVGGYYVIEDVDRQNARLLEEFLSKSDLACRWAAISLFRRYLQGDDYGDNTLIVLQKDGPSPS